MSVRKDMLQPRLESSGLRLVAVFAGFFVVAALDPAWAYRPFNGTDAAVADTGEMEVELQPAGRLQEGSSTALVAPATVLNFGFAQGWEAVLEGRGETPLSPGGPTTFTDGGAFLKHVVREGSLQDKQGPSIAIEFGTLLPDSIGENRFGTSLASIVSQRFDWGAVHFNLQAELTRDQHADIFVSTILEGPSKWTVRPVAEFFYEREFDQFETVSALAGLIWQVRENVAVDFAVREAWTNGRPVDEIRAGVTFGVPIRLSGATPH
jgi:hypothetical protein